jgi:hypothetical protein
MIKALILLIIQIVAIQAFAQISSRDSIYFQGKYYKPGEYEKAKAEYDRYNFEGRFMPGIGYGYYHPAKSDSIGDFHGISVKYLFYRDVSQNENSGPSHLTFYGKFCLFNSSQDNVSQVFIYSLGIDLSFEKNPHRNFCIPYFGLEVGGLSQKSYGTTIQFTPTIGLHLLSKKNFTMDLCGGYIYPVRNFEDLAGWYGDLNVNFVLW